MRKGYVVLLAALAVAMLAAPAMAEISFFGTARVLPTYYSNFDFDDNLPDVPVNNEAGFTTGEHVRSELRLGWKAGGDKWKIMFIAETDLINEKDTADRSFYSSGTKVNGAFNTPNAGGEFGIERVELNYSFAPALVLSTGWNIRAADIKTGGLLFGDDHPFIELGGKLTENLQYALTYLQINNRAISGTGFSPVHDDWRAYLLKVNAIVGAGDVKFDLSPFVLYSDNRMRNADVYYYGIEGTGQIGFIKPSFEFVYADGEFKGTPLDIKAYAAFAGVELALSKAFNPYIAGRFATGDDNSGDNDVEGFVGITDIARFTPLIGMDGNILGESMGNPYGNVLYSYAPERRFTTHQYGGIGNAGSGDNPGHLIAALGAKGALSEAFSYKVQAFMVWFDQTGNLPNPKNPGVEVDDYAGTVVDLQLSYKFSPNFSTYIIGSTFIPGDGIKDQLASTADDTYAYLASLGLVWTY